MFNYLKPQHWNSSFQKPNVNIGFSKLSNILLNRRQLNSNSTSALTSFDIIFVEADEENTTFQKSEVQKHILVISSEDLVNTRSPPVRLWVTSLYMLGHWINVFDPLGETERLLDQEGSVLRHWKQAVFLSLPGGGLSTRNIDRWAIEPNKGKSRKRKWET